MTRDESSAVGPSSDSAATPEDLDLRVTTLEDRLASLERGAATIGELFRYGVSHLHTEPPPKEEPGFFESLPAWLKQSHC